jgi:hypothetical protein
VRNLLVAFEEEAAEDATEAAALEEAAAEEAAVEEAVFAEEDDVVLPQPAKSMVAASKLVITSDFFMDIFPPDHCHD